MAKQLLSDFKMIHKDRIDLLSPLEPPRPPEPSTPRPRLGVEHTGGTKDGESDVGTGPVQAQERTTAPESSCPFQPVQEGLFQVCTIGAITYRIGGLKEVFVSSLRISIRASLDGRSYYDTLDLYSARSRISFAQAIHQNWGVDMGVVQRDLVQILEYFETSRDQKLQTKETKHEVVMSPEDHHKGMELLQSQYLLRTIVEDLGSLGYVGEEQNKLLLYLCASSRKLDTPMSVLILSQSASGKSFLVESVRRLMPPEDVVAVTSLSDQALNYMEDLLHKFLILGEAVHGEVVEHQIREMLSAKELSRMVTIKDVQTGRMQTKIVRTPVVVASVMSGTQQGVNPENASRCFVIHTDESKEQTSKIHAYQRIKYTLAHQVEHKGRIQDIVSTHHAAQRLLTKRVIVNPFAPYLNFPVNLMRTRRDHDRFLDLIASVCFVRQYQKEVHCTGETQYIQCDLVDYEVAYKILVEGVMGSTIGELPKGAQLLYEEIRKLVKVEAEKQKVGPTEVSVSQRHMREASGFGHTWVRENLRILCDYEYLVMIQGGQMRSKSLYRLKADEALGSVDVSMIPDPVQMEALMREQKA